MMGRQLKNYNYSSALLEALVLLGLIAFSTGKLDCSKMTNLTQYKLTMQDKVKKLSDALVSQYANVCQDKIKNCNKKTFDLCQGTSQRVCINNFPTLPHCIFKPGIWTSNSSGVRISNVLQKKNLSDNARKFICVSALIQPAFEQLRASNDFEFSFAYIGSSSGAVRVFPAFKQGNNITTNQCSNYDPRKRPWYVSAITGSKTTIILLDVSRSMTSMHPGVRFTNAKVTLQIIFGTLNNFDYVGVVIFSKNAHTLIFDTIVRASTQNKQKILAAIKDLEVDNSGSTNYTAALQVGINMLTGINTFCGETAETVFLLLTDGYTENDPPLNVTDLSSFFNLKFADLNKNIQNFKLISFVYGIQSNINYTIVGQLTCLYKGIVFRIWDGIDEFGMVQKLTSYYIFLSEGINKNLIKPVWSEIYEDAFGFGKIMTVTIPIYVEGRVNKIVGVAGIDILIQQFYQCGYNLSEVDKKLKSQPQCFKSTLNPTQLLYLQCQEGNIPCSSANMVQTCNLSANLTPQEVCGRSISYDVFYPSAVDTTDDDEKCCAISIRVFLIILLPSLSVLIISLVIFILYKKGILKKILQKIRKQKVSIKEENDDGALVSLLGDTNLKYDKMKKYKLAEQNGVKIYRQKNQFSI